MSTPIIPGLNLDNYPRIDSGRGYRDKKKYIYLLGQEGDDDLFRKDPNAKGYGYYSDDITFAVVTIFDESTNQISTSSVYRDHIGTYIKKRGRKYRLDKFSHD